MSNLKTAESVSPKHPDKICDFISDSILDALVEQDKNSRVAIETMGGHNEVKVTGEVTTNAKIDYKKIVQSIVGRGYKIDVNIVEQSREIGQSVDVGGAGDQGIMVGYACNDNNDLIPQELYLARDLCKFIYNVNQNDGKTQITLNKKNEIEVCVCSFCGIKKTELTKLVNQWLKKQKTNNKITIHVNPSGEWFIGGFDADAGVTGRKLIVDNYGPQVCIGGGAFSGKDITKVDRSGAYAARRIAVDILNKEKAKEVIVKLAYAIGVVEPVMIDVMVDSKQFNFTNSISVESIKKDILKNKFLFSETSEWGAFGNGFCWDN